MNLKTVKTSSFITTDLYSRFCEAERRRNCADGSTLSFAFVLFAFCHLTPWLSTAIGAFVGGVLNCVINYRFTFHATGVEWRAVVTKFLFRLARLFSAQQFRHTDHLLSLISDWNWIENTIGLGKDAIFLSARLLVALVVSLAWNFLLQRSFVFKTTPLDKYILKVLDRIGIKAHSGKQ